ncbi:DEAD/DEAH box helicase [Ferrimonas sp. SCSIO 43195]|uniref:DEAD/DEAH box helicase n=1 Tax=Ferrimonas sp. SCSIO 43195 TaxID=2822844 RepID=UPI0020764FE9|nr:DEAD/DEAH box helicase [Ferrimonas sp. SCSIO 43195]USD39062.1 DEAD/DEAH box helicase [Ferrimonas sp. SCSIO 43195]
MTFSSLSLHPALLKALADLNYQAPTPIQAQAIPEILAGKDLMAGAQTGTGKTAAFTLPLLHQLLNQAHQGVSLRTLVLVPTRELAQQVYRNVCHYARHTPLTAVAVYGGTSLRPQMEALQGGVDLLVATPGRLLDLLSKQALSLSQVQHLVFDEADRILDLGFKEEITQILAQLPKQRQTLLFSATFDDSIFKMSHRWLTDPVHVEVDSRNSAAVSIDQHVYVVDADRKRELVSYLIGSKNWHQVLLFTKTRQGADALAKEMVKDGISADAIHGDKSQGARDRALEGFKQGTVRALVATDVAARGIDITSLAYVINVDLPFIAEDYVHRIGRCGRAGATGLAISLLSPGEEYLLEEIEAVLDQRLPQQWLPGFEPDFSKPVEDHRKNSRTAQRRRVKKRAQGGRTGNRRR